jgi:hypothetical protein
MALTMDADQRGILDGDGRWPVRHFSITGRRHHLPKNCGKLVTEEAMRSSLLVCTDPAWKYRCLDATSTSHGKVGLCPIHCLLCTACPACDVVLLNALLCVHGAHACILSCGVLLMPACWCLFSLTTLAGLHVPMLFKWCVQAFPSGHVGPPATAWNKSRLGKGLQIS